MRHLLWLALIAGCGARSGLTSDDFAASAAAGTSGSGSLAGTGGTRVGNGGASSSGGAGRGGSATNNAGAAGRAGNASAGAGGSCTCDVNERCCTANEACVPDTCVCLDPKLLRVEPPNARNGVPASDGVQATFSCSPDPRIPRPTNLHITGRFAAQLPTSFPTATPPSSIVLQLAKPDTPLMQPYFPGELITGWLGAPLGGPFLWQYTAAVRRKSSGKFSDTGQALSAAEEVELADLDHDGDLDLVAGSAPDQVGRVWSNDGHGNFALRASLPPFRKPLLGDVDGDGDLDIVTDHLYLNDGMFKFTESATLGEAYALFDADGDGDLDVFATQNGKQRTLFSNDGAGRFTPKAMGTSYIYDAQAGDLDNDGDLDLVLLTVSDSSPAVFDGTVLLNDGKGAFLENAAGLLVDATRTIALGDVDRDGDLDVFMASWGAAGARNPADQVWLNDGNAHFKPGDAPLTGSIQILFADLDGDGDLDAIAGQHPPYSVVKGEPSRILLNDGKGRFTSSGTVGGSNFQHLAIGDLDGDGDLDAVVAQWDWTTTPAVQVWLQDG